MKFEEALLLVEEKEKIFDTKYARFKISMREGAIPHFHFFRKDESEGCIEIAKDKSANHKPNHTEFLTNKEKRELAFALCLPFENDNKYTNYQYSCINWNSKNINGSAYNKGIPPLNATERKPLAYLKYLTSEDIEELKKIPNSAFDPKFEK